MKNKPTEEQSALSYWLDKAGAAAVLLGPAETAGQLAISGNYTGPSQLYPGMGVLTAGLGAWNAAKYVDEHNTGRKRSPLVHTGRAIEIAGAATTEGLLINGEGNIFRIYAPMAIGIPIGALLEYVAGPVHERFSNKYRTQ
jgi:hypothetical protein